jgi:NAD(P)-dependent dehydrogenase (short-subunit alcohol dehydrogenase family)
VGKLAFSFEDEVVIVTGAARGIGKATAQQFVKSGATVALLDNDSVELQRCSEELGPKTLPLKCDVTDENQLLTAFDEVLRKVGYVSVLVNSAGMSARVHAEDYSLADYDRLMTLNARALFSAMQICAKQWIAAERSGAIVNIASIFGMIADPLSAPYAASKGAVIELTKTCAVEWARHGIRVNAVAPGYTYTAMTAQTLDSEAGKKILDQVPMKRAATVEEIANAVLFLASDAASFVTGHILVVDGGRTVV